MKDCRGSKSLTNYSILGFGLRIALEGMKAVTSKGSYFPSMEYVCQNPVFYQNFLNLMPKIVVKVDRKTHTRSHTHDDKKGHHTDGAQGDEHSEPQRATTPSKSASKAEPRSSISRIQRSQVKLADRKFFTVKEDHTILDYIKQNKDTLTSRAIADNLAKKLKHTSESIRDRVKRFLSKLRPIDELYIAEEAKVN